MAIVEAPKYVIPSLPENGVEMESERRSGIDAPTMQLTGHTGEVFCVEFSPDGKNLATAGADGRILVFNVYGECRTWACLRGHKNAVLEIKYNADGTQIYSCSADNSVCIWDVETNSRIKKFTGHLSAVNSISTFNPHYNVDNLSNIYNFDRSNIEDIQKSTNNNRGFVYAKNRQIFSCTYTLASASDDGATRIWDVRTRKHVMRAEHQYQILSVAIDGYGGRVFSGSLDNSIRVYDLRKSLQENQVLTGHGDSITGLSVHPNGTHLLSNSMDQTVRIWDIQPFPTDGKRLVGVLRGATHNFEKNLHRVRWSACGKMAGAGSADKNVYVWNVKSVTSPTLLYRLPGHIGAVNDISFHPREPIIASVSSDKTCYMGELS